MKRSQDFPATPVISTIPTLWPCYDADIRWRQTEHP